MQRRLEQQRATLDFGAATRAGWARRLPGWPGVGVGCGDQRRGRGKGWAGRKSAAGGGVVVVFIIKLNFKNGIKYVE